MIKNHWCPVGNSTDESGYTLIELLVVLATIALLAGAVPIALSRARPGYDVRSVADLIANELRGTRERAIRDDRDYVLRIDNQQKLILTAPAGRPKRFPSQVNAVSEGEGSREANGIIAIRLYADGSSDGAVLRISAGVQRRNITVDEVTGRVSVNATDR